MANTVPTLPPIPAVYSLLVYVRNLDAARVCVKIIFSFREPVPVHFSHVSTISVIEILLSVVPIRYLSETACVSV